MSTSDIKLQLFRLIDNTDDASLLKKFYVALTNTASKKEIDWWNTLSDKEKVAIEDGLDQVERGEVIPNEEVMKKSRKVLSKYKK